MNRTLILGKIITFLIFSVVLAVIPGISPVMTASAADTVEVVYRSQDGTDHLKYIDHSGNIVDTGIAISDAGGVTDISGDGDLDIAYVGTNFYIHYYDTGSDTQTNLSVKPYGDVGGVGDVDGDGDKDITYRGRSNDYLKYVDPSGNIGNTGVYVTDQPGGVADFDGDGDMDIAYADYSNAAVKFVDANGNVISPGGAANRMGLGASDFDGDGLPEATYVNGNDDVIHVDANGNNVNTGASGGRPGGTGDFDGDGDQDIIYINLNGYQRYIDASGNIGSVSGQVSGFGGVGDIDNSVKTVTGYIKDSQGNLIQNATVTTNTSKSTQSNSTGYYEFSLNDGTYNITASKENYLNNTTTITVTGSIEVNITIKKIQSEGYVQNSGGNPISSATVTLEYAENNTAISSTTTDSNGYYSFGATTEEETELVVSKSGYSSEISRTAGSNASFTLEQTSVSSGIIVEGNNVNLEGVTVSNVGNAGILLNGTGASLNGVTIVGGDYGIVVKKGAGTHDLRGLELSQSAFAGVKNDDAETVTVEGGLGDFVDTVGNVME